MDCWFKSGARPVAADRMDHVFSNRVQFSGLPVQLLNQRSTEFGLDDRQGTRTVQLIVCARQSPEKITI